MPQSDADRTPTKGERTAARILDEAEKRFAQQGYDRTTLRQIADAAGIREPGLYNHFASKQALYEAVLDRALTPMAEVMDKHLLRADSLRDYTDLPAVMTDLLLDHPQMAALFQQALQGDQDSVGNQMMARWLERLLNQGMDNMERLRRLHPAGSSDQDRATLSINLIAMFNLTTGYFLSQRAFAALTEGHLQDPDNIARQKALLHKVIRAMLVG
ncbi:MAG: helix-turn-helix domain-containing protein [Pseudomonadota bacterium]